MTDREPYLTLRGFRVWFAKRRGFVESLRRAEPAYVRAVDGIDLDVRKGEVYCLVGESGCGKTTTGKGILQLVDPTSGDVFVNVPREELGRYEAARAQGDEVDLEAFRRRWSLSYKEKAVWTWRDALLFVGALLAGFLVAGLVGGAAARGVISLFGTDWIDLAAILAGTVLGLVATLPFIKATKRVPQIVGLAAVPTIIWMGMILILLERLGEGGATDLGALWAAYGAVWGASFLLILVQVAFACLGMFVAWQIANVSMTFWQARKGIELDRMRKLRKSLQIIFQDPYESLNPKHSVYDIVSEPLIVNGLAGSRAETDARVEKALDDAGLRPPRDFLFRYPHELSGGQRQRVSIAGALVLDPDFLVADEPVSMLDVSIRTEIVELLLQLREQKGLTYLFITHDLSLAWVIADRIGVMYLGKIVEEGTKREVVKNPKHPYTKALISVVPVPDPDRRRARVILKGERPDPSDIPAGCRFHPRCPVAFERCGWTAHEVLEDLQAVAKSNGRAPKFLESVRANGSNLLELAGAPADAEAWVRDQIASRGQEYLSLRAIRAMEREGDVLRIRLHEYEEPTLKSATPDARVACHLYG